MAVSVAQEALPNQTVLSVLTLLLLHLNRPNQSHRRNLQQNHDKCLPLHRDREANRLLKNVVPAGGLFC
jgi:hypothetical protein